MAHGVFQDPEFDFDLFSASSSEWAGAGAKRLTIEWQTGPGPIVAWYPAGARALGKSWRFQAAPTQYNERYADYLEYRLMPRLSEIANKAGMRAVCLCVDQQPIQVMRMRRRELERAELTSGIAAPAH
jgi:hypothetical protein